MYGRLSDGVMVTQRPLEALFMVRIHVGQPILKRPLSSIRQIFYIFHLLFCAFTDGLLLAAGSHCWMNQSDYCNGLEEAMGCFDQ